MQQVFLTSSALKLCHPTRRQVKQRWLECLRNVRGIGDCHLYVGIEHGCDEDKEVYQEALEGVIPITFVPNTLAQGPHGNNVNVFIRAIEDGAEFINFFEDDVIAGPDVVEYFDALGRQHADDPTLFCINTYTANEDVERIGAWWRKPSLGAWGFGMWRDRALECVKDYKKTGLDEKKGGVKEWDIHLNNVTRMRLEQSQNKWYTTIFPCFARALNIGMYGIHFDPHTNYKPELDEVNRTWTGNMPKFTEFPDTYYEVPAIKKADYLRYTTWKSHV